MKNCLLLHLLIRIHTTKDFIHSTVDRTCRAISYDSTVKANKAYTEFRDKFYAVIQTSLEKVLAEPDLFDSLLADIEYKEIITKELKQIFRPSSYHISQIINRVILDAVPARILAIMETDPIVKKFNEEVRAELKRHIADTTVEAEVNRLMGRR